MKRICLLLFFCLNCLLFTNQIYANEASNNNNPTNQNTNSNNQAQNTSNTTTQNQPTAASDTDQGVEGEVDQILAQLTPKEKSALETRLDEEKQASKNPFSILLFQPTYILPFYYTGSPDQAVYAGTTPNNQKVMNSEFKGQLSFLMPVITRLFYDPNLSLNVAYTQLNYWQVYASSQYFRETDYEPEIFVEDHFYRNWLFRAGTVHQSNGRGGDLERSWNRAYSTVQVSGNNWLVSLQGWFLIFANDSSNIHNPDIAHYLGYENLLFAYRIQHVTLSLQAQNLESGLQRGFIETTASYPITKHILFYVQYFNGYGQSLIEYNHRTQSAGVGIAFNDWM